MGYQQVQWRNRRARRLKRQRPGPFPSSWDEMTLSEVKRWIYRSQKVRSHGGAKVYKQRYTEQWRQQRREQEYAALIGDDVAFERICPEGTRGAIGMDIW